MWLIANWQPTSSRPDVALNTLDDVKSILRTRNAFFEQGIHRAYIVFLQEMLDWPLFRVNATAKVREPLAYVRCGLFQLNLPLLAPAPLAKNPTCFEASDLLQLEKA